ncbi:PREDICTED: TRPM8 channel-associated factor homolog, partial [Thamnophis sirtalis]|uniref:TRPM8 channel-associated factor homolog n=1 Tax=Thamnophis sirtalis TaxID=35019 RepID=A0A6I9Z4X1_9SAUR
MIYQLCRHSQYHTTSGERSRNSLIQNAYNSLLRGIPSIDVTGDFIPCELLLTGDQAFPVLIGSNGQVLIAAAQYGKGRVVVTAHESMIQLPQFLPFIKNALDWLRPSPTALIGVHGSLDALSKLLLSNGIKVQPDATLEDPLGVFFRDAYDSAQADDLVQFIKRGGGLLIGGQAWLWSHQHGKEGVLVQFPGNLMTGAAGVYFTAREGENGIFCVPEKIWNDPSILQPTTSSINIQHDYNSLVQGIQFIDVRRDFIPCELLLTGDQAFPLLVGSNGQVLIAASQYGKGRMVVAAHEAMIQLPEFLPFIKNALDWLKSSPTARIGVHRSLEALSKLLLSNGIKVQPDATLERSLGVFCRDAYDSAQADDLLKFVKRGGGLLIGGQAWHWSSEHGKEGVLIYFPGNLVTSVAGVYFTGNVGENGVFPVPEKIPRIPLFTEHGLDIERDLTDLLNGVERFNFRGLMIPSPLLIHGALAFPVGISDTYDAFLAAAYYGRGRIIVFSREGFLTMSSMIIFFFNAITWLSAGRVRKVGVAYSLPELYSMLNQTIFPCELTNFKKGLGIYCCKVYDVTAVERIQEFVSEGGGLLIGGQSWHWASVNPDSSAIAEYPGNKILNKFGIGIVGKFLEVSETNYPAGEASEVASTYHFRKAFLKFKEHIRNEQILQPPYSLWFQKLAQDIAIFLEIPAMNSRSFSSVHEEVVELVQINGIPEVSVHRSIHANTDHAILLQIASVLYNVLPEFQALVPSLMPNDPNSYPTAPPQNIQINGSNTDSKHTDYPIIMNLWAVPALVDVQAFYAKGTWGPIHELGHNQQKIGWEFSPYTEEATCNLFSVYVNETVLSIPRETAHPQLQPQARKERIEKYIRNGANLKDFEVFTALEPYLQVRKL